MKEAGRNRTVTGILQQYLLQYSTYKKTMQDMWLVQLKSFVNTIDKSFVRNLKLRATSQRWFPLKSECPIRRPNSFHTYSRSEQRGENAIQWTKRQLYLNLSTWRTILSLSTWKFWKIRNVFDPDGQLDSIAPVVHDKGKGLWSFQLVQV